MQLLAQHGIDARRYELKRLGLRLLAVAGRLMHSGRGLRRRIPERGPRASQIITTLARLHALPEPT